MISLHRPSLRVRARVHLTRRLLVAASVVLAACSGEGSGGGGLTDPSQPDASGASSTVNPIAGARFWVDPASDA